MAMSRARSQAAVRPGRRSIRSGFRDLFGLRLLKDVLLRPDTRSHMDLVDLADPLVAERAGPAATDRELAGGLPGRRAGSLGQRPIGRRCAVDVQLNLLTERVHDA